MSTGIFKVESLFRIMAKRNPILWEEIDPLGHAHLQQQVQHIHHAAEPDPVPWSVADPEVAFQVASARVARDLAAAAFASEAVTPGAGVRAIQSAVDDWCGTGRPFPWPGPWPFAFPLDDIPKGLDVASSRLTGALTLGGIVRRMAPGKVRDALGEAGDRLLEASLAARSVK
jgi:hypothetical protein